MIYEYIHEIERDELRTICDNKKSQILSATSTMIIVPSNIENQFNADKALQAVENCIVEKLVVPKTSSETRTSASSDSGVKMDHFFHLT